MSTIFSGLVSPKSASTGAAEAAAASHSAKARMDITKQEFPARILHESRRIRTA